MKDAELSKYLIFKVVLQKINFKMSARINTVLEKTIVIERSLEKKQLIEVRLLYSFFDRKFVLRLAV